MPDMSTTENLTPQQRLANSRQALVGYMAHGGDDGANSDGSSGSASDSSVAGRQGIWQTAKRTVQAWWRHHPAHAALDVAVGVAHPVLNRYAQDKPLQLVAGAAALGAALVVLRPWRLVSITGLLLSTLKSSDLTPTLLSLFSAQSELDNSTEGPPRTS